MHRHRPIAAKRDRTRKLVRCAGLAQDEYDLVTLALTKDELLGALIVSVIPEGLLNLR